MKKFTPIVAAVLVLLLIAGALYWYSYHVGVKEEIDRTVDALAILEDGTELPCTVRFLGTLYVDHPSAEIDQFHGGYDGGIWINDHKLLPAYVFTHVDKNGILSGQYYLNRDMTVFAAKVDAADIFPDMESQTVYVVLKSNNPEEYSPILDLLMDSPPPTETAAPPETTLPPGTTEPLIDYSEYEALLDFSAESNWLARSLGCIFEKPEDIDLYYLFYLGVDHPGSWDDISPESEEFLLSQNFMRDMDLQIMPVEKMEAILRQTFGIELKDVAMPKEWRYIEAEDAYCSNHNDAYFPGVPNITAVEDDGETIVIHYTIDGFWLPDSEEFLDPAHLVLTLNRQEDGAIHAVSNVLAPGA